MPKLLWRKGCDKLSFPSKPLPQSHLPTNRDVLCYVAFLQDAGHKLGYNLFLKIATDVLAIYLEKNATLSLLLQQSTATKVKLLLSKQAYLRRSGCTGYKRLKFDKSIDSVFEVLKCQCSMSRSGDESETCKVIVDCNCAPKDKLPEEFVELIFEARQRGIKTSEEVETVAEIQANERREQKRYLSNKKKIKKEPMECAALEEYPEVDATRSLPTFDTCPKVEVPMPTIAREAMRWGTSDREVAAIVSATLIDFGLVNPDDPSMAINDETIRREKSNLRNEIQQIEMKNPYEQMVKGIYFETLSVKLQDCADPQIYRQQQRVVVLSQPGGRFLSCITPEGNAEKLTIDKIMTFLGQCNLIRDLKVVGADSSVLNTGDVDDLLTRIEKSREEKVHRSICNLHSLDLCLQHLFEEVIGASSLIGRSLPRVGELYWNETFPPILSGPRLPPLENETFLQLPYDLQYLYLAVSSIRSGRIPNQLTEMRTGKMNSDKWVTVACRICRLYLSQHCLQGRNLKKLNDLTYFIVTNYAVMWIEIKLKPYINDASNHLLRQVQLLRVLPSSTRTLLTPFVQSWNAHPENLLISLLCHDDQKLRNFGIEKLLQIRVGRDQGDSSVRSFSPPRLNFSANSIADLIDWDTVPLYESVLTRHLSITDIQNLQFNKLQLPLFPSYSRSLERSEAAVTSLATSAVDEKCSQLAVI